MADNKKFKINFFDIIILVIVACIAIGLYIFTHKDTTVDTKKLSYIIELNDVIPGTEDNIKIGSSLTENTKNYNMGKVVSFETRPYKKTVPDYENNIYKDSVDPTSNTILITVEANVTESNTGFAVDGKFVVRAGTEIFVKGEGFAGEGYIVQVNR